MIDSSDKTSSFMEGGWFTERRAFKRIPTDIGVNFFFGNSLISGKITNLSENGMFVNTKICFPLHARFEILLPIKKDVLNLPVKVSRVVKEGDFYDTMGIEVLSQSNKYLNFVSILKGGEFNTPLKINDEILNQTTKCSRNFQCLTDNGNMCIIDRPINGRELFIKERVNKSENCPYIMSSGHSFICTCPTRYEIYTHYKI